MKKNRGIPEEEKESLETASGIEGAESQAEDNETAPVERISFKEDSEKILHFILTDDWENVLAALTKDMDPWDVNLVTLSERFTSHLETLQRRDLRAPSRVILAAAIIYRLKSETLRDTEEELEAAEEAIIEEDGETAVREQLVLPPMEVPLIREPRRKVTVRELVNALGKAMNVKNRREARKFFTMELKGMDITKKIEEIYGVIINFIEKAQSGAISFTSIFARKERAPTPEEKLLHFNSILHLSTQERITCTQDTLFGEIYITKAVPEETAAPPAP